MMALPLSILLLFICWYYLVNFTFTLSKKENISRDQIRVKLNSLGKIKYEEVIVLLIFIGFVFSLLLKVNLS